MKTKKFVFLSISIIISFGICALVIYLIKIIFKELDKTLIQLIPLCGAILVAAINNYFTKTNQIESEERIKRRQIDAENRREKQKNYNEILTIIGNYIRHPNDYNDQVATIQLKTWIYGNPIIVSKTRDFIMQNRNDETDKLKATLKDLVREMRKDIGLNEIDELILLEVFR